MCEVSQFPFSLPNKFSLKTMDKTLAVTHRLLPLSFRLPAASSVNFNVRLSRSSSRSLDLVGSSSRGCTLKCSASTLGTLFSFHFLNSVPFSYFCVVFVCEQNNTSGKDNELYCLVVKK